MCLGGHARQCNIQPSRSARSPCLPAPSQPIQAGAAACPLAPHIPLTWGPCFPFALCCSRWLAVWFVVEEEEEEQQPSRKGRGKKAAHHQPTGSFYTVGFSRLLLTAVVPRNGQADGGSVRQRPGQRLCLQVQGRRRVPLFVDLSVPAWHLCPAAGEGAGVQGWGAPHPVHGWTRRGELKAVWRPPSGAAPGNPQPGPACLPESCCWRPGGVASSESPCFSWHATLASVLR